MVDRTRRAVLVSGVSVAATLAGCLGRGSSADPGGAGTSTPGDGPDDTDAATEGDGGSAGALSFDGADRLGPVDADLPQCEVGDYYLALLTDDEDREAFPTDGFRNEAAVGFLEDTDFSRAAVVVVQDRLGSSVPDLELQSAGLEGSTATVEARYPGQGSTDDVIAETLLVRVATGGTAVTAARATIHPQFGDPIRLDTDGADAATSTAK